MSINVAPSWIQELDDDEIKFIKNFLLASGSLKEIAKQYNVTYPTVRLRMDKLISKIRLVDKNIESPYITLIKRLVIDEKIDFDSAKILIEEFKKLV